MGGTKVAKENKKSSKGAEKKAARKAELEAEKALKAVVSTAAATNLCADFPIFCKFNRNGLEIQLESPEPAAVTDEQRAWCVGLLKENMQATMEAAGYPWNETEQLAALKEEDARLLLLKDADGPVGFSHFRYMLEGDCPVLYVYELQLTEKVRGKGLGKQAMALFQLAAVKYKMSFVMCTVFKSCERAMKFFMEGQKFMVDETSPSRCDVEDESPYEILSRCLDPELLKKQKAEEGGLKLRN